ncbi:MAG: hypothetical protein L3J36_02225 [Rhodobacteraceae bacterium]|nr:hypothetical protein [Paracoccaceae bacterium]
MRWFIRMSRWARNPPSPAMFKMVVGIILVMLLIYGLERIGWWPDWATSERLGRVPRID